MFLNVLGDTVREYPVPVIEADKILDTNGAGDSFVGGFLAQLVQGKDLDKCVDCGIWVCGLVIQQSGFLQHAKCKTQNATLSFRSEKFLHHNV
jgi:adenosine kinase